MDTVLSLLISDGIIAFGVWVVAGTIAAGWPLAWTLMGLLTVIVGLISLYGSVREAKNVNCLTAPLPLSPSRAMMILGFADVGLMAYRRTKQDGAERRVIAPLMTSEGRLRAVFLFGTVRRRADSGSAAGAFLPRVRHQPPRKTSPEVRQMARAGFGAERMRVAVGCSRGGEMSDHQREIYHSENGDKWFLCRDDDDRVSVLHRANVSSGGTVTKIELGDFLGRGKAGPEHQALARLIGSLVDRD